MRTRWKALIAILAVGAVTTMVMAIAPLRSTASGAMGRAQSQGFVTWSDAVIASKDARTLTVSANVERVSAKAGCAKLSQKVRVEESTTTVRIRVQAFTAAYPPGTACTLELIEAVPVSVRLEASLGSRQLVDATGDSVHSALDLSETPTLRAVPAGFHEKAARWDETTGVVDRWWRRNSPAGQIDLTVGPAVYVETHDTTLRSAPVATKIDGADARLRTTVDRSPKYGDTTETELLWRSSSTQAASFRFSDEADVPATTDAALKVARSLR